MKSIKNESLQGLEVFFTTEVGPKSYWLRPKEIVTIPENYVTKQIKLLVERRILKIFNA